MYLEIFLVVFVCLLIVSMLYRRMYYKRYERRLLGEDVVLFRITPSFLNVFMIAILFSVFTTNSIVYANELENQLLYVDDEFNDLEFENETLRVIYTEYNMFFAGYYYEGDDFVLCLKEGFPEEIHDFINKDEMSIKVVQHNYSDLLAVYRIIAYDRANLDILEGDSVSIYIDFKLNIVVLGTENTEKYLDMYDNYIDKGMLLLRPISESAYR